MPIRSLILPILPLLIGVSLLLIGNGLFGTLLAVRGTLEGYSDRQMGLIMSAYFLGFLAGTYASPGLIRRIGHIRAFALLAAIASSTAILHTLWVHPLLWGLLRMLTGACLVGLYVIVESWLNADAPPAQRGRIFALYMAINFASLAVGQALLTLYPAQGFQLFSIVAMLLSLSLVPIALAARSQPHVVHTPHLSLHGLYHRSPVGIAGALGSGIALGAFWGLGPVAAQRMGLSPGDVAMFMAAAILGGALLQWPVGRWSDRGGDRRRVLFQVTLMSAAVAGFSFVIATTMPAAIALCMFLFGGLAFAIYPVSIALTNDRLLPEEMLQGASSLLLLHGIGAATGPALAGQLMQVFGAEALLLYFAAVLTLLGLFIGYRLYISPQAPDASVPFMPMVRTTPAALELLDEPLAAATATAGPSSDPDAPRPGRTL